MVKKIMDILRRLVGAAKARDMREVLDVASDAADFARALEQAKDLLPGHAKMMREGAEFMVAFIRILSNYTKTLERPTGAEKAKLQSELAEFIHAAGAAIDVLPTREDPYPAR